MERNACLELKEKGEPLDLGDCWDPALRLHGNDSQTLRLSRAIPLHRISPSALSVNVHL